MEIERKFLLQELPDLSGFRTVKVVQCYIALSNDSDMRIRKINDKCSISCVVTVKTSTGMSGVREELETEIPEDAFIVMRAMALKTILKDRYFVDELVGGRPGTIDVFHGKNEGLVLAEVEFKSVEEAKAFMPLPWMGKDVTDDPRYLNRNL